MLTLPQTSCDYHDGEVHGMITTVKVDAKAEGSDHVLCFLFDLRKSDHDEGRWETDGVRIEC